jgi:hypothetical protein
MMQRKPGMTPDELATAGRALYGERWQTSLAHDLHVSDRTMRRWLTGESPIPAGVVTELRAVLVERLEVIGGIVKYQVVAENRRIHNYHTGASYRYDNADNVALLHPGMAMPDQIPLVTEGAKEALRKAREHDPSVQLTWVDQAGRPAPVGGLHGFLRGSVVIPPEVDLTAPVTDEVFAAEEGKLHR